ncbi:hypothetical protein [Daejeonella sp.]|uniref:hypothetical protein n=1 Tax=Daejeonella sp. TaxID=2805397 RepID=UPI003983A255
MVEGLNYITDAKGKETGIILDLVAFRKHNIKAFDVINALSGLQELIDQANIGDQKTINWNLAKKQLEDLKTKLDK